MCSLVDIRKSPNKKGPFSLEYYPVCETETEKKYLINQPFADLVVKKVSSFIPTKVAKPFKRTNNRPLKPGEYPQDGFKVYDHDGYTYSIFNHDAFPLTSSLTQLHKGDIVYGKRKPEFDFLDEVWPTYTCSDGSEKNFTTYALNPSYTIEDLPRGFYVSTYQEDIDNGMIYIEVPPNFRLPQENWFCEKDAPGFKTLHKWVSSEGEHRLFKDYNGEKLSMKRIFELRFEHLPKNNIFRQIFYKMTPEGADYELSALAKKFLF